MSHTYTRLYYHIVFSTKERQAWIEADMKERLYGHMTGIITNLGGIKEEINGIADHVHILAHCPAKVALAEFIGKIKANSSGWVHEMFPELAAFAWQRGYAAFTVSESNVPAVRRYIQEQERHHQQMTFQEELITLLVKHRIAFDAKYLWD
jgi:REP element-mobilizing transposase RayT